jgi:glycosyltransferase involved in cell wall biosynthesis
VLPLNSREQIINDLRALLTKLADEPTSLREMGIAAQQHVKRYYTWQAKAEQIREVYRWILEQRDDKPTWGTPMGM